VNSFLDGYIGELRLWRITYAGAPSEVPNGWGVANGTDNSGALGGSGLDLRGQFMASYHPSTAPWTTMLATGGGQTHTHAAGAAFGTTGTDYAAANHLPPYRVMTWIERLDNSTDFYPP
jgi:hypothetical protein